MGRTLDRSVLIGVGLLAAFLVFNAAVTYRNTQQLNEDAHWVAHTNEVLDLINGVLLALVDAETGERGFIISGKDEYLQPYDKAVQRLDGQLAKLKDKTKDNVRQQARIEHLESMTANRVARLQQVIELRRKSSEEAKAALSTGEGKVQMDALRVLVGEMREEEHVLLEDREGRTTAAYRTAVTTGLIAALLGLATIGAFLWLLQRSLLARQQAAAIVHEQREWLRTTLASIGDAVMATDTEGKVRFLNPVAEALTGWRHADANGQSLEKVFQIVNEQTRLSVENPALRALREGMIIGLANHTVLIAKDGTERPIDDSAAPIRDMPASLREACWFFATSPTESRRKNGSENCSRKHRPRVPNSGRFSSKGRFLPGSWPRTERSSSRIDYRWMPVATRGKRSSESHSGNVPGGTSRRNWLSRSRRRRNRRQPVTFIGLKCLTSSPTAASEWSISS